MILLDVNVLNSAILDEYSYEGFLSSNDNCEFSIANETEQLKQFLFHGQMKCMKKPPCFIKVIVTITFARL